MSDLWNSEAIEYLKLEAPEATRLGIELERERIKHLIQKYSYLYNHEPRHIFLNKEKLMKDIEDGIDYRNKA